MPSFEPHEMLCLKLAIPGTFQFHGPFFVLESVRNVCVCVCLIIYNKRVLSYIEPVIKFVFRKNDVIREGSSRDHENSIPR